MNDPGQNSTKKVSARRQLIRGAFSLPAVLAVHNGSALAAASSQLRCAIKATESGATLPPSSSGYIRLPLYKRTDKITDNRYVLISDLKWLAEHADLGVAIAGLQSTHTCIRWDSGELRSIALSFLTEDKEGGTKFAAVLFDSNGTTQQPVQVVGIVKKGQTNAPEKTNVVSESCWTSLKPSP